MKKIIVSALIISCASINAFADDKNKTSSWAQMLSAFTAFFSTQASTPQRQPQIVQYQIQNPQGYVSQTPPAAASVTSLFESAPKVSDPYSKSGENPGYRWPVPEKNGLAKNTVVSPWGPRCHIHPDGGEHCGDESSMHNGVDINVPTGTKLSSMIDGQIAWVDPSCNGRSTTTPPGGCSVSVVNDKGEMFTYMHLSNVPKDLKAGQSVKAGDDLGESGNTGKSTGPHLHLAACEIKKEKITDGENPMKLCKEENGGKAINPLDKLDPNDPRAADARKLEKLRDDYHKCLKTARSKDDTNLAAACKKAYAQRKAMPTTEYKPVDTRQSKATAFD